MLRISYQGWKGKMQKPTGKYTKNAFIKNECSHYCGTKLER